MKAVNRYHFSPCADNKHAECGEMYTSMLERDLVNVCVCACHMVRDGLFVECQAQWGIHDKCVGAYRPISSDGIVNNIHCTCDCHQQNPPTPKPLDIRIFVTPLKDGSLSVSIDYDGNRIYDD